jgi:quercetin dioxygenase-like cupin family protein
MRAANSDLQLDDENLRITQWHLPPDSEIGWHRHGYNYIVVPITGGALTIVDATGRHNFQIQAGKSYARKVGVEHNVLSETSGEIGFVETEIKERIRP